MNTHRYLNNVVTLKLDPDQCTGCGRCLEVCPHEVFTLSNRRAVIRDRDACMECGACARNCAFGALSVKSGVGCASAIIFGAISSSEPTCGSNLSSASAQPRNSC
jgi:NAD-dependent dihydropyrimidine dehydrogenase PreA subunit